MTLPDLLKLPTPDGRAVAARFYAPTGDPVGAVLVAPAMGARQRYYAPLARWLAAQGYLVATFDYRGIGESRDRPLRGYDADILDWARLDSGAVLDALSTRAPNAPLHWVGHSLGGQILPWVPGFERVRRAVTIGTGNGYWGLHAPAFKPRALWLWYLAVPLALRVAGYFPGRALRKVGDLPRGVMAQWRRWCLNPTYAAGAEGAESRYASVTTPITSLSFTDDELMTARSVESLHGLYVNAPRTMQRIAPRDAGLSRIGHFGFFRAEHAETLWARYLLPALV